MASFSTPATATDARSYLTPRDHPIGVTVSGPVPQDANCVWTFDDGDGPVRQSTAPCNQEVRLRVRAGSTTVATVDIPLGDGTAQRVVTEIAVRDVLIAGLGDSIAAGEGNPDKAVELDGGFCFRRFFRAGGSQYFRPSRAGYSDDRSCELGLSSATAAKDWARHGARWMNPACHRSLYSYQVRTALALAIEQPHIAVTFIPLACTGATIDAGMFVRPARRRLSLGHGNRQLLGHRARRSSPSSRTSWRRRTASSPTAISTWSC